MKKNLLLFAAFLGLVSTFTACVKEDDPVVTTPTPTAKILVTHASPDAPGVDLLVDNVVKNSAALNYPSSTTYITLNAGMRNIKVNASGTSTSVINADVTFVADKSYSIFAADSLSAITPIVLEDNLATPAAGKAHVRFVHLSPNAPAVDIAVTGGSNLFPNVAFKESVDFTPVAAGTVSLDVKLAGTSTVVLTVPGVTLEAGKIYTIFAKGFVGGMGAQALGAQIIANN
jgi:hypothetical protein